MQTSKNKGFLMSTNKIQVVWLHTVILCEWDDSCLLIKNIYLPSFFHLTLLIKLNYLIDTVVCKYNKPGWMVGILRINRRKIIWMKKVIWILKKALLIISLK